MKCIAYKAEYRAAWDDWVDSSRTPLFFFKRDFMEYHSDRFQDSSLMFYEDEKLVAIFPASRTGDQLVSHEGLTFGGMLFNPKVRADLVISVFDALLKHARFIGCKKIIYKAIPYIFSNQGSQEDLYALTLMGAKLVRRDLSSVIHLNNRPKLSKGRKWLIARAKKMKIEPSVSEDWDGFHKLLCAALKPHSAVPVHSVEELRLLHSRFPNNIKLKVIVAHENLVAAALLFHFNDVTHTQYLATNEEGKDMGALDALVESCIQESEAKGDRFFSFGISTENAGKFLNSGLINQKENFGARGLVLDFYEVSTT